MRSIGLLVGHERLHRAAQRDARGQDVARAHVLPSVLYAPNVADKTKCADDAAVGVWVEAVACPSVAVSVKEPHEEITPRHADAGLQRGAQQDLVHVAAQALEGREGAVHVRGAGAWLHALQEDGAGDAVGTEATGLHLIDQLPSPLDVGPHRNVQQLVEGHRVGPQAPRAHGLERGARRAEVAAPEVRLDHRVVGDDVGRAQLLRFRHDAGSGRQVPALHTGVEQRVVEPRIPQAAPPRLIQ
mmetsp:Transcript_21670/g.61394  ORF Transcript_21670/g.61394 Transcript_21670/m.61394 type:complete len:243 (+) Transcript_21670:1077-1805(+)